MAIKDDLTSNKEVVKGLQNNKVTKFCYTDKAYEENDVNGVRTYSFDKEQNIPDLNSLETNATVITKGYRTQASSLARMLVNHIFGRVSYNLNKIVDTTSNLITSIDDALGKPNGIATLDAHGRIPYSQLPESAMEYKGMWNAETNTPTLTDGEGTKGDMYVVSVGGTQTFGGEEITFLQNDQILYDGEVWNHLSAGSVRTVNSVTPDETGNVLISSANIEIKDGAIKENMIASNAVTTAKIASGAVTTAKIADLNVTEAKLASNAVTTAKIKDANVTADKIASGAVTTAKIADLNVTEAKLASNAVTTAKIKDANVTTAKIADLNVTEAKLASNAVTTAKIKDANVTTDKIASGAVTTAKIADLNVTEAKLASNAVTIAKIAKGAVTTARIADLNVTEAKLADGAVTNAKIKDANVTTDKIADLNVTEAKLADGAITADKIADLNVTEAKLASGAVTKAKIKDASIITALLANNAVTYNKLADNAVTTAKIASGAVTNAKIAGNSITAGKLADFAVTTPKIDNANVTTAKIKDSAVTTDKIANFAVTTAKIPDGAITADKILDKSVTGTKLASGVTLETKAYFRYSYAFLSTAEASSQGLCSWSITVSKLLETFGLNDFEQDASSINPFHFLVMLRVADKNETVQKQSLRRTAFIDFTIKMTQTGLVSKYGYLSVTFAHYSCPWTDETPELRVSSGIKVTSTLKTEATITFNKTYEANTYSANLYGMQILKIS